MNRRTDIDEIVSGGVRRSDRRLPRRVDVSYEDPRQIERVTECGKDAVRLHDHKDAGTPTGAALLGTDHGQPRFRGS